MKHWTLLLLLTAGLNAQVLYVEQFDSGMTTLDWFSTWGDEADQVQVDWDADNPSGDGFIGKLGNGLSGGGVGTAIVDAPELDDCTVEAWIWLETATSHYRGIVGRANDIGVDVPAWEFYAFVADLSEDTGMGDERFLLRRWFPGGSMENIREWTSAELGDIYPDESGWYKLSMRFEGDEIFCALNDQDFPGGPVTDNTGFDPIPGGGFGVYYFHFMDSANFLFFDDVQVNANDTSVDPGSPLAGGFMLGQPYPNPFNPHVLLPLMLDHAGVIQLEIRDLRGALVRVLHEGPLTAGQHSLAWDGLTSAGAPAASGSYVVGMRTEGQSVERMITLLR